MKKQTVGMLMGIWNEADRIVDCLDYHLAYMDEIAIVIQQSDDGTEEVVKKYLKENGYKRIDKGLTEYPSINYSKDKPIIKLLHYPMMGCSEATLQFGCDALTSDWVFYIDADEKFPQETLKNMQKLLANPDIDGYRFERDNYFDVQVFNDAQPMEPKIMRIKHPQRDPQLRLTRRSISKFYPQIHVRVRIKRADGREYFKDTGTAILHLKTLQEQWNANREYLPATKLVDAMEKTKKNELINLPNVKDENGTLVFAELEKHIPFEIKRVFYTYGIKGKDRGGHANTKVSEVVICLSGGVKAILDNGVRKYEFNLNDPTKALFIKNFWWVELKEFQENTILLVLASEYYSKDDYIHDYDTFYKKVNI